jgi:drug/metabolite transporter (DMT)-like permease
MKTETTQSPHHPLWLVVTAFAAVYVIWGSTYLGIRYAVESIPPFVMAGSRHVVAGVLLFLFAWARGAKLPTRFEWRDAAIAGTLMLVVGNGGVTWAEQMIPSGIAALLVALTPVWMVLIDWARPGGVRPRALVGLGLAVGLGGVVLLARKQMTGTSSAYGWGVAALMAASICWALGSVFNRTARKPKSSFLGVALQMITGGVILLALALLRGEQNQFSFTRMTALSFWSWVYLTIAGSLIAYTAYIWLLHATTPARVATYAYVNPLIAVLLGCTIGREVFSSEIYLAGGLIIVAVVLVLRGGTPKAATPTSTHKAIGLTQLASPGLVATLAPSDATRDGTPGARNE